MYISNRNVIINILIFICYGIFSVITYFVVKDFLHIFLIWNLLLSVIPYIMVFLIDRKIIKKKSLIIIALLVWLFFFPNAMYIVTDLIYTDVSNFISNSGPYQAYIYLQDISSYMALIHIFLGAFLGLMYGFKSLKVLYDYAPDINLKKYRDIVVIAVFGLSSFAIYIGRFFRYNSWDIFRVFTIIARFFDSFSWFTVFFIGSVTILQMIMFYALINNFQAKK